MHHLAVRVTHPVFPVSGYNDMPAVWQRLWKSVKGFAPHDHGMPGGSLLEVPEIIRKVPGQVPIPPQFVGFACCRNKDEVFQDSFFFGSSPGG